MRGRTILIAALALACASVPTRPRLDASATLAAALPAETRLAFEEYQVTEVGRMLSIALRVAHSASRSMDGIKLVSCAGQVMVGEGAVRRTFPIAPRPSLRLPAVLSLAWIGQQHDGSDKQPAYYEYAFEPAPIEGLATGPIDYEFTGVVELQGRPIAVSGRGRALPGGWRGSYPPPERGTAARY
jgi:hypothetical protein